MARQAPTSRSRPLAIAGGIVLVALLGSLGVPAVGEFWSGAAPGPSVGSTTVEGAGGEADPGRSSQPEGSAGMVSYSVESLPLAAQQDLPEAQAALASFRSHLDQRNLMPLDADLTLIGRSSTEFVILAEAPPRGRRPIIGFVNAGFRSGRDFNDELWSAWVLAAHQLQQNEELASAVKSLVQQMSGAPEANWKFDLP